MNPYKWYRIVVYGWYEAERPLSVFKVNGQLGGQRGGWNVSQYPLALGRGYCSCKRCYLLDPLERTPGSCNTLQVCERFQVLDRIFCLERITRLPISETLGKSLSFLERACNGQNPPSVLDPLGSALKPYMEFPTHTTLVKVPVGISGIPRVTATSRMRIGRLVSVYKEIVALHSPHSASSGLTLSYMPLTE